MEQDVSVAVVAIKADLTQLRKEMKAIGPEAAAAANDMAKAVAAKLKEIEKSYKASADAAKKAADEAAKAHQKAADEAAKAHKKASDEAVKASKTTGRSWNEVAKSLQSNQMISDLEQVSAMFMMVGGTVSKVSAIVTSAIRPLAMLGTLLSPAALGMLAIPAAGLGVVAAIKGIADAAVGAADRLDEMGRADAVPAEARRAMRDYEVAVKELNVTLDTLKVTLGQHAIPLVTKMTTSMRLLIQAASEGTTPDGKSKLFGLFPLPDDPIIDGIKEMSAAVKDAGDQLWWYSKALATGGSSVILEQLVKKLNERTEAEIRAATAAENARLQRERDLDVIQANVEAEDAYRRARTSSAAVDKAKSDAAVVLRRKETEATKETTKAQQDRMDKIREALAQDQIQLQRIKEKNDALWAEKEALQAVAEEGARQYVAAMRETIDSIDMAVLRFRMLQDASDNIKDAFQELIDRNRALFDVFSSFASQMVSQAQTITRNIQQMVTASSDALEQMIEDDRERIRRLRENYQEMVEEGRFFTKEQQDAAKAWTDAEIKAAQARIDKRKDELEQQQKAASLAYGLSQSFATTQAIISAAVMAVNLAAQLSQFSGVPAIPIALSVSGAMLAAQLAAIATAPPPQFPTGGMVDPDHHLVGVRGDEGILSARGLRAIGGEEGLDTLNGGGTLGGGADGPETVSLLREIRDLLRPPRGPGVFRASRGRRV